MSRQMYSRYRPMSSIETWHAPAGVIPRHMASIFLSNCGRMVMPSWALCRSRDGMFVRLC